MQCTPDASNGPNHLGFCRAYGFGTESWTRARGSDGSARASRAARSTSDEGTWVAGAEVSVAFFVCARRAVGFCVIAERRICLLVQLSPNTTLRGHSPLAAIQGAGANPAVAG